MSAKRNLIGEVFYSWEVLKETDKRKHGSVIWNVRCNECNREYEVTTDTLKNSKKCLSCAMTKHGHGHDTPTYKSYWSMRQRCMNVNNSNYKNYGGRGIKICERWMKFENFLEDMGQRPKEKTIDRINNNGDYAPENCKWSTVKEQRNNSRQNKLKKGDKEEIRKLCECDGMNKKYIAEMFNISVSYAYNILRR